MGQGWANEEETTFLQGYMPKYELCQVKRNYQNFWPMLFSAYQKEFPIIDRLWPGQSKTLETLTPEENEYYNKKLKAKQESLKEWYRWRANPRSRNTSSAVTKKDLKSIYHRGRTRSHKNYEVFAKLYRDTVEPIVEEACRVQGVSGKSKLPVWHKTAARLWRNASQEQIEAVNAQIESEAGRDKDPDDDGDPNAVSSPETYQQPRCAESWGHRDMLQFGDSEGTPLFTSIWPGHEEQFVENLGRFARKYEFSEELCARRSLIAAAGGSLDEVDVVSTGGSKEGAPNC
ncbi:hypothetical protein NMY22_g20133 [Coprinellus aureogranulatus]|nr:hypothetical protein NMY22_g20133 [Coprinellus aureogranulatus]